jgi:aspartate-semialdehyde dehydrogenase
MHLPDLERIAIVGATGLVGRELHAILRERDVTESAIDTTGTPAACELAFLAVPDDAAPPLAEAFLQSGATVVDLSASSRERGDAPLVIPSLNGHLLDASPRLIANPNCTATILVMAIAPLRQYGITDVHVSTYQAISGAGKAALAQLEDEEDLASPILGEPLAFNVFRHESEIDPQTGRTGEEQKLISESRRLLELPDLPMAATCMRVPVRRAHLESITVQLKHPTTHGDLAALMSAADGVTVLSDRSPTSLMAEGRDDVLVGHLRVNNPTSVSLIAAGDQLRVGAALNAVRIAERLRH